MYFGYSLPNYRRAMMLFPHNLLVKIYEQKLRALGYSLGGKLMPHVVKSAGQKVIEDAAKQNFEAIRIFY